MSDQGALVSAHLSRYDALLRTSRTLAQHRTITELFDVLAEELHPLIPFDYLALVVHEESTDLLRLVVLEPTGMTAPSVTATLDQHGPAATVWTAQKAEVIPIPDEGTLHPTLELIRAQGRKMTCWLPLTTAHKRVGVLSFGSRSTTVYTDDVVAFMEQVAAGVAIAVENGINREQAQRYEHDLQEERDRLRFLLDINNLLVSRLEYPDLLKLICDAVQRIVEADQVGVALFDSDSGQLRLDLIYDKARGYQSSGALISTDKSAAGVTFQRGIAGVFRRSEMETLGWEGASVMKASGIESMCCVPLTTADAKLGTLFVGSKKSDAFSDGDVVLLGHTSAQIAIAIANARAYERITTLNAKLADEKEYLERDLRQEFSEIVGTSQALTKVLSAVKTVAPTDSTVLLLGETGTGKELIARGIHELSTRRDRTFIRMNAAALPASLFESELFGHERGAFTGATASRAGRLELANRGTLFLDEVGDIPTEVQPKLLRVLQEREFERLGSTRTQRVDIRVVAATNRDLERMVEDGSFRSDLYYRLNVFPIMIPPLRERPDDIPALARHFVSQCSRRMGRTPPAIADTTMDALKQWKWPGNIRELQNVIERAVILSPGQTLAPPFQDLPSRKARVAAGASAKPASTFKDAEKETILRALRESGGVIAGPTGAAARLGLQRTTLQSKMRRLGIRRPGF
jgi:formate hydrogenlyase transcriptional activator